MNKLTGNRVKSSRTVSQHLFTTGEQDLPGKKQLQI